MKFRWRLGHTMEQVIKKRLQQVMDASVAKGETPGCLLMVIKDGEEQVYLESGYADIEAKKPVSRDNIFRLYSMSKPITATAMMILVERGIVDLADPVSKYLPGFRNPVVCTADGKIEKAEREILLVFLLGAAPCIINRTQLLLFHLLSHFPDASLYYIEKRAGKFRPSFCNFFYGLHRPHGS